MKIAREMIAQSRARPSVSIQSKTQISPGNSESGPIGPTGGRTESHKVAHNIAMRFRQNSSNFTSGIGESWNEYIAEYLQVARDYDLNNQQKLLYLHDIIGGDAKRFYLDSVYPHVQTFNHAVEPIGREYNSSLRQNRVKNLLNTLRLKDKLGENQDEGEAVAMVYKIIAKLAPLFPTCHRGNAHKIEFLHNAVVRPHWAAEPLSRTANHNLSFQKLYGELEAVHQLDKDAKLAVPRDKVG